MKMNDYIKELRDLAEQAGVIDATEMHEVLTLSLFKLLNSEATSSSFNKYKLEHYNDPEQTLRIMNKDIKENYFMINPDNTIEATSSVHYSADSRFTKEVKSSMIKEAEIQMFNLIKDSDSFTAFYEKYSKILDDKAHRGMLCNSSVDMTLIKAYKISDHVKKGLVVRPSLSIEPFGEINASYKGPEFADFSIKNISDKLNQLQTDQELFRVLASIDGLYYTSFEKFKEVYTNGNLDKETLLSKLLSSDEPSECIDAVFGGEWFETYKSASLRSCKKTLMSPSVNDLYEMHPVVNSSVDTMFARHPYFSVDENNTVEIKVSMEHKDITPEEMDKNKKEFLDDVNKFKLDRQYTDDLREGVSPHTRVYITSPFGVLMDIGGRHNYKLNPNFSLVYINSVQMNTKLSDENELLCINRFLKMCQENKIICAYEGDNISSRVKETISNYKGVVSFDKSMDSDVITSLRYYHIMMKDMQSTYDEILSVHKDFSTLPKDLSKEDIIPILEKKVKQHHKLTL